MINKIKNIFYNQEYHKSFTDVSKMNVKKIPSDIYIIGNGTSLNNIDSKILSDKFTIGTNRSWLWTNTDILIWRDARITQEINFFQLEKESNCKWICSIDKSFVKEDYTNYSYAEKLIDFTFEDQWLQKKLNTNIKWNGIVFHAIALAKHISKNAKIHLIGIDLNIEKNNHHFFNQIPGFNQGFYRKSWNKNNFNYQKRLDMMYQNFELLKNNGYDFMNYSSNSKLKQLFGINQL